MRSHLGFPSAFLILALGCGSASNGSLAVGGSGQTQASAGHNSAGTQNAGGTANSGGVPNAGGALDAAGAPSGGGAQSAAGAPNVGTGGSAPLGGAGGGAGAGGMHASAGSGGLSTGGSSAGSAGQSGVAGKTSTGGTGGGGAYQPCPSASTPCKVLPFGDSITFGVGDEGNGGYRGPLFASVIAAGQKLTFTGSLSNGPNTVSGQTFAKNNEGHSGWGISRVNPNSGGNAGIINVLPSPAFSSGSGGMPNIILLHIGTNDQGTYSAAQITSDLTGLIDKVTSTAPDALLVVAQIIPLGYGNNSIIQTYNQAIPGIVQQRAATGKHVALVDMYTGFNASTMLGTDKVHPNTAGYTFMAGRWYAAIKDFLPK